MAYLHSLTLTLPSMIN